MEPVLQVIRRLSAETTDAQLLERYATAGDQQAFAQLVERHGRLVLGVCRRILTNSHDAEDAFQAVFVLLARKARSLRDPERLSAWLHGVAVRVAKKSRSLRQRQQQRDQARPVAESTDPAHECLLGELLLILDEQLHTLPARYRVPLILHHLEGHTQAETARHLGCPPGTVAARLARGRDLLRKLLERRGFAGVALTALLARAETATAGLMLLTLIQGTAGLAGAGAASGTVQTLVNGVTTTMMLERIRRVAIGLVLALVCLGGPGWVAYSAGPGDPPQFTPPVPAFPAPRPSQPMFPLPAPPTLEAVASTTNFRVHAPSQRVAQLLAETAEKERLTLARKWLGKELPDWPAPCPVWVRIGPENRHHNSIFSFAGGKVSKREMHLTGPLDQLLAAQVPHEVMHAILADHLGQGLPRWADEGIASLAEDETSQKEIRATLAAAISRVGRLPFAPEKFLASKDYPERDLAAFYAMSHGLCEFLIGKTNDRSRLLGFVADGQKVSDGDWGPVVKKYYGMNSVKELEDAWLASLKKHLAKETTEAALLEKLFPTVQPELALAKLSADGQFVHISRQGRSYEPVTRYRAEDGFAQPVTSYRQRTTVIAQVISTEGLTVRTAGGKVLTAAQFRERLKEETFVFWHASNDPLPESYLKLLREGTLILSVPTQPVAPVPVVPPAAVP